MPGITPSITIITVNFNNAKGLEKTIQSVISQDSPLEYIVIDGNSTDDSTKVVRRFQNSIAYWVSEPDNGIYHGMNKGIKKATGDYILFLNSGDELLGPSVLSEVMADLEGYDLLIGAIKTLRGESRIEYPLTLRNVYWLGIHHQGTFIKKTLFSKVGLYNEGNQITSDWQFFMLALFKYNVSYTITDRIISVYGLDGLSSLPSNKTVIKREKRKFLANELGTSPILIEISILITRLKTKFSGILNHSGI